MFVSVNLVFDGVLGGDMDNRNVGSPLVGFQYIRQSDAVQPGHQYIADNNIRLFLFDFFQRLFPIGCFPNLVVRKQDIFQKFADILFIFYNQYTNFLLFWDKKHFTGFCLFFCRLTFFSGIHVHGR